MQFHPHFFYDEGDGGGQVEPKTEKPAETKPKPETKQPEAKQPESKSQSEPRQPDAAEFANALMTALLAGHTFICRNTKCWLGRRLGNFDLFDDSHHSDSSFHKWHA
jgi:hypothetical protein